MFESPHDTNFGTVPLSNGGALLLVGTTVVGSRGVDVSFCVGEDFEMLVWSIINAIKTWRFFVRCVTFSSVFICFSEIIHVFLISLLLVALNGGLEKEELCIRLGIHIVTPICHFESSGKKSAAIWRR